MHSGLRHLTIRDDERGLEFPAIVQYPTGITPTGVNLGPYRFEATLDAPVAAPETNGGHPLALISHGSGGSHLLYRTVGTYLAQRGWVVVAPEHPGNNRNDNSLADDDENVRRRPAHGSLTIDALLAHPEFARVVRHTDIAVIGHSIGGYTALTMAGGTPWSHHREPLTVRADPRVGALVLLAPATLWFQPPDALANVTQPILLITGTRDTMTPALHGQIVCDRVPDRHQVTWRQVEGANHYAFLAPFPAALARPGFLPATDEPGFDRVAFHGELSRWISEFLSAAVRRG
jgi:predicted dienelactone hydrolase